MGDLERLYRPAQPASKGQIETVLYGPRYRRQAPPKHIIPDSEPNSREEVNGSLGGRRGDKIRQGVDRQSWRRRTKTTVSESQRPRGVTILPHPNSSKGDSLEPTGTDGNPGRNFRQHRQHHNEREVRSPQCNGNVTGAKRR